ncbi:antimicrobial or toxin export ABC-type transporter, ATPase component [Psychroflexus torquis ATCC 700755]|uniref:Antimicrobial or toxin export ABC-type transporter, ATPase component n=1 Tax=Psychroflexus torquis (strain ATCC 700755 / CIP 106069 / ACAM 623) TaxID=313595 RepID=K4IIT6_PSYTT|nr:ATP-binding cassette domain-containing protein [Psychroflexus torquis]AFU68991.1 antimicrobial or toxin export ABC-type transporter, ATPase component [Psychroflexus torquis ATCC 700755]
MTEETKLPWIRLLRLLKLERSPVLKIFFYAIFAGLVELGLPLGIQAIVNIIIGGEFNASVIVLTLVVLFTVAFAGVLRYMQLRIGEDLQQRIFARSSFELIYRFPKMKYSELQNQYPPELANRFFDVMNIQKALPKLVIDFSGGIIQILFGLILLSFYHPFFILFGFLILLLFYIVFKLSLNEGVKEALIESKYKYQVAHWIQEVSRSLEGFKVSESFSYSSSRNDETSYKYLQARERHFRVLRFQFFKMIVFKIIVAAALLIVGGLLVINQQMNIGQFVAAEIIILLMINSVEKLILGLESVYDLLAGLEKFGRITDIPLERQDGEKPLRKDQDMIFEYKDVNLYLLGKHILKDINVEIRPKDLILVQGTPGSGKTTLLRTLVGLIEEIEGSVFVNDINLKNIEITHFRDFAGHFFPNNRTFQGTILENITLNNPEISMEFVNLLIERLQLKDFVKAQDKGLQTVIYSEGRQLPYTVSKKIMIARALASKPKLLVLKDPTEDFLDEEESKVIDFITDPNMPWAVVIVSRSDKWKSKCNRFFFMDNGVMSIKE